MSDTVIDQVKLNELIKNGWSYRMPDSNAAFSTDILLDPVTGKRYRLHVRDQELTMTEVTDE